MRLYAIFLSAFLLASNQPFAQDGKRLEERPAIALAHSPSAALVATTAAAERNTSPALCFGFLVFDSDCDAPAGHLRPLPQSPAQIAGAAEVK